MRKIVHISDLHFGKEDIKVQKALLEDIAINAPDLIVISGDLTQRAKPREFKKAIEFIHSLNYPKIIIPGNHDISLFNVFHRLFMPLYRYKKFISNDSYPFYMDDQIAVIGINTARPYFWKEGFVSHNQLEVITENFSGLNPKIIKILITHHPLLSIDYSKGSIINPNKLLKTISESNIDLLLAGHLHRSHSDIYPNEQVHTEYHGSFILVQASTSISKRLREDFNAYNIIEINWPVVKINIQKFNGSAFAKSTELQYIKVDHHWQRLQQA